MSPVIKHFKYDHLPLNLHWISKRFSDLAALMEVELCDTEQKQLGLQKLLEAKDCFIRASLETIDDCLDKPKG